MVLIASFKIHSPAPLLEGQQNNFFFCLIDLFVLLGVNFTVWHFKATCMSYCLIIHPWLIISLFLITVKSVLILKALRLGLIVLLGVICEFYCLALWGHRYELAYAWLIILLF